MKNRNFSLIDKIGLSLFGLALLFVLGTAIKNNDLSIKTISNMSNPFIQNKPCKISAGQGFHMDNTIAIKFNSNGRFNYSDNLMNIPKSFWGTWEQQGNKIITTNDRSTTGMGVGQKNTYVYDCNKLTIGGFTLVKD